MDALNTALFQLSKEEQAPLMRQYNLEFLLFDKQMKKASSKVMKEYFTAL
ncbi:MAG: hypothetical protein OEW60_02665 [Thiovulaceae bacterium]|nr:hypothetical protein [Sulfurimonadaceae bacterium]